MSIFDDVALDYMYLDMTNIDDGLLSLSPTCLPKSWSLPLLMVERRVVRSDSLALGCSKYYTGLRKQAAFVTALRLLPSVPSVTVSGVVAAAAD